MGFSALTSAKTEENNGFRTPLPYVFAARRTVGQPVNKSEILSPGLRSRCGSEFMIFHRLEINDDPP
jgi:hypothetical protein